MAKKDRSQNDETIEDTDIAPEAEVSAETAAPDLTGLIKMEKEGKHIHAHPDVVKHHSENGWKRA